MLQYCDKCGHLWNCSKDDDVCEFCQNTIKPVPEEYFEDPNFKVLLSNAMKEKLMQDLVLTSPNFEQSYYDNKKEYDSNRLHEAERLSKTIQTQEQQASNIPKCPTCQSTNIRKIGGVERGASIWAFGLFSKKINKTFKCQNCGYTW